MTIAEIVTFAEHYGFELPEHRDLEFDIKLFNEVIVVYDTKDLSRGNVIKVQDIKSPGTERPFPVYECIYEMEGRRIRDTFTPSEVRKV